MLPQVYRQRPNFFGGLLGSAVVVVLRSCDEWDAYIMGEIVNLVPISNKFGPSSEHHVGRSSRPRSQMFMTQRIIHPKRIKAIYR